MGTSTEIEPCVNPPDSAQSDCWDNQVRRNNQNLNPPMKLCCRSVLYFSCCFYGVSFYSFDGNPWSGFCRSSSFCSRHSTCCSLCNHLFVKRTSPSLCGGCKKSHFYGLNDLIMSIYSESEVNVSQGPYAIHEIWALCLLRVFCVFTFWPLLTSNAQ